MDTQLAVYLTLVTASGSINFLLGLYAYAKRHELVAARTLVAITILQGIYIFAFAFELSGDTLDVIKRWITVEYIGIAYTPVVGLLLVLQYTSRMLPRAALYSLFLIPTVTLLLVASNDWHHIFYKSVYFRPGTSTPLVDVQYGYWYIVHGAYTFSCLLVGIVLLLKQWRGTKRTYKGQLVALLGGQLIPIVTTFLYVIGKSPYGMDLVPFVLSLTTALYIWAMRSSGLMTISPIAKEHIVESMREGVIVLDLKGRLIDYNAAVRAMFPGQWQIAIGKPMAGLWQELIGMKAPLPGTLSDTSNDMQEMTRLDARTGDCHYYQVRFSGIRNRSGNSVGKLLMFIDITELKQLQEKLRVQAYYDGLTGIFNRTQFILHARELLEKHGGRGMAASVVLFDIDRFKEVNDTYGHETGDRVIQHVVTVCQRFVTGDSMLARYGGEEFVLLLPGMALREAADYAEQLRAALSAEPFQAPDGLRSVTASFGVAALSPDCDTIEQLLRHADAALYEAKRAGRNKVSEGRQP
ncbi:diguanylate cyclase [Paenibacillus sp. J5C_2022]|uniref:histidine kinase N-terminal 7TM domain-containing diguanylate cyclase n=1 Tax=Paenibacillus sp. J5C2022 TaxID=2977129 RepID=UPI0021CEE283|nr:histidine kinase N-terminal 7TM domain-containing protein [Paenibacillus sp. J5C2022]MCU6708768.1 diguanylate cyclase [Paenibacillus sp. J5C2022]